MIGVLPLAQLSARGLADSWLPSWRWLHTSSDLLLAAVCLALLFFLLQDSRRRRASFAEMGPILGVALGAIATSRVLDVWSLWHPPAVSVAGTVKVAAALAACGAVVHAMRLRPRLLAALDATRENSIPSSETVTADEALARATAQLAEKEARLELLARGSNEGVWEWDLVANEVRLSDRAYRMLHLEPPGRPETRESLLEQARPVEIAFVAEKLRAHRERGEPFACEHRYRRRDGSLVWLRIRGDSIRDADGRILRMAGSIGDIEAERRAVESMHFQTHILSQVNDAVVAVDPEERITYWNGAAERLYGMRAAEALGRPLQDVYHYSWPNLEQEKAAMQTLDTTGQWRGEVIHTLHDGRQLYVEVSVVRLKDDAGQSTGRLAAIRDVTKQRELEEQVRVAQRLESIGLLAGGVAHDFNNLLQVIQGYTSLSLDAQVPLEERNENLQEVRKAAERAAQLTSQLLAFSRKQTLQKVDLDLNALLDEMLKMIRRLIGEQIQVDFIPGHELGNVRADRGQIEQILLNLCINARDAMPKGGRLTIETENVLVNGSFRQSHPWSKPGRYVLISVTDSGIGMDRETQRRIFEPFFTTKPREQGTGLGLAVVYGVVKQHEGMVHVYSELGVGTTFKIYLPISARSASATGAKLAVSTAGGRETILVAEDDAQVRQLAQYLLKRAGYRVLAAADGEEACELFSRHAQDIDLLVLDVVMPRFGGRQVYERVSAHRRGLPVIYCSGYTGASLPSDTLHTGAQLLAKPYSADDLLVCVRAALDQHANGPLA